MAISLTIPNVRQPTESLYDFLERRERELEAQLSVLRADVSAMETELAHVQSARRTIGNIPSFGRAPLTGLTPAGQIEGSGATPLSLATAARQSSAASNPPTIRDMILKALWTGFRDTGATQAQLRRFILDAYGRDVDRTSISPQISRMKEEGLIKQKGGDDNWRLTSKVLEQFGSDLRFGSGLSDMKFGSGISEP